MMISSVVVQAASARTIKMAVIVYFIVLRPRSLIWLRLAWMAVKIAVTKARGRQFLAGFAKTSRIKQHPFCKFGYPLIASSSSKVT